MRTFLSTAAAAFVAGVAVAGGPNDTFRRIATIPVFENTDINAETVSEIIASANNGNLLVYTDGASENIGFIDITDPENPTADGIVTLPGEPTSVAVIGPYALAAVNTSPDFVNPSGSLEVIHIPSRTIVRSIDLGGQPDAVAISPDGKYAAIVLENERDEDLGDGEPPQLPGGDLIVVDLVGMPAAWTTTLVEFDGVCDLFPNDPEPEFVDINAFNVAVVTFQENNHLAFVDLATKTVIGDFSAGTVDLTGIDTDEEGLIDQTASLSNVPREPDAVAWITPLSFATADEGDLFGGSRGFTIFSVFGTVLSTSGNTLDQLTARIGHYPEERSGNKGNEPEGIEYGDYGPRGRLLFVGSERSSVVFVYRLSGLRGPELVQVLPSGVGPEGLLAIPQRGLFVTASEEDARDDGIRSVVSIYRLEEDGASAYPNIVSENRTNGLPIPWAALSGFAADPSDDDTVYTVYDSFYRQSRIFTLDVSDNPARITDERALIDGGGVLASLLADLAANLPATATGDFDPSALVNGDNTVNLDPEGVTVDGSTWWVASEGTGNLVDGVSDPDDRPFERPNLLVQVDAAGTIIDAVSLPLDLVENQFRFGFEGCAVADGAIYVAFQRSWSAAGDPSGLVRIGRFDLTARTWTFAYYTLDAATSPNGGWVGLSDLTWLGNGRFAVIERDNQAGSDAAVKRLYTFSTDGITFMDDASAGALDVVTKTLVRDHLAEGDLPAAGGVVLEKLEGLAVLSDGTALIVNDNDGVDDSSGETQLLRFAALFDLDGDDCPADLNGDGFVGVGDLLIVLGAWGPCNDCPEDLNGDGVVNFQDLLEVIFAFGPCD